MKHVIVTGLAALCVVMAGCRKDADVPAADLSKLESKVSYGIGMSVGKNIKGADFAVDQPSFQAGLSDMLAGRQARLSDEEVKKAFEEFRTQMMAKEKADHEAKAAESKTKSDAFLAEYAKQEGVTKTASGLMYKVITAGSGPKPKAEDTVTVNYEGTLVDGTKFDSSYDRKEPASFPVGGVIPGWVEALQLMPVGSTWEVVIPSELGYGEQGAGPIPPNAALKFKVELIKIGAPEAAAPEGEPAAKK